MGTDIDWQHAIDGAFGTGHDVQPAHYVEAGRKAVRRRRATVVVVSAAVVIGCGAAWAVAPGSGSALRGDAPVATSGPAPNDSETRSERQDRLRDLRAAREAQREIDFLGEPATLDANGLVLAPGAGPVLQRVANPMGYTRAQGQSLGIRVMFEGREKYSLLVRDPDGGTSVGTNDATGDFAGWLDGRVLSQRSLDVDDDHPPAAPETDPTLWLRLRPDGDIVAAEGTVLLEVRADPDLGDFALGAERSAAVRVWVDDRQRYAAYRVIDGTLEVIAAPGSFQSMNAFVEWARQQYSSGEGMR